MNWTAYVKKFIQSHSIILIEEQTPTSRKQEKAEVLSIALCL